MKKKLMTLQQHRLLKEAGQLIAFSERLKHVQKETTDRNREEREEKRQKGLEFAAGTDWEKEADKVYQAVVEGITEDEKHICR